MPANTDTRYQSLSAASYAISSILIILITICFVVKVSFLRRKGQTWEWDSIVAYATYFPLLGHLIVFAAYTMHGGFKKPREASHGDSEHPLEPDHIYVHLAMGFMALYYAAVFFVKVSLLALFVRVFSSPVEPIRKRLHTVFGYLILANIILLIIWTAFVTFFWATEVGLGLTFNATLVGIQGAQAVGWMNAVTNFCLLLVPFYCTRGLQLHRKSRISIYCIMLLGLVATVVSALRGVFAQQHEAHLNTMAGFVFARFASCAVEACLGYICFCLPAFRGLGDVLRDWRYSSKFRLDLEHAVRTPSFRVRSGGSRSGHSQITLVPSRRYGVWETSSGVRCGMTP